MTFGDSPRVSCGNPACTAVHPPVDLVKDAAHALGATMRREHVQAVQYVERIAERYGGAGVVAAMSLWCQHYERSTLRGVDVSRLQGMTFVDQAGRPVADDASEVDPATAWAGRYALAWARHDDDQLEALIGSVASDPVALTECCRALLLHCGLTAARRRDATVRARR